MSACEGETEMKFALSDLGGNDTVTIPDGFGENHTYAIAVEYRGVWHKGNQYKSLEQAIECARKSLRRSRLRTQVRSQDGIVCVKYPEDG